MNQGDFHQFGLMWRQEPADEEVRIFRSLVRRAGWRGRALEHAELGLGLFLIAGGLAALLWAPAPATLVIVALIVAGTLWSSWKRHQLRQTAMLLDRSDRETMLASAIVSARARLRRSTIGLALIVPGWLLGVALKGMLLLDGDFALFLAGLLASFETSNGLASAAIVLALLIGFGRGNFRLRREARRLEGLRRQYRFEALLDPKS